MLVAGERRINQFGRMLAATGAIVVALLFASAGEASEIGASVAESPGGAWSPSSFELLGTATLPQTRFGGAMVGGLSGLAYDQRTGTYFALADDRGAVGAGARIYRLAIDLADGRFDEGDAAVVGRIFLRTSAGALFESGILDPEGLALDPRGGFFIATEGIASKGIAPFVASFSMEGRERESFPLPARYLPDAGGAERGVRDNLGFESLTVTPDGGWLVAALESALRGDGPSADVEVASLARWIAWPLAGGAAREYAYRLAPLSLPAPAPEAYRVHGLSEIAALSSERFLALEREFAVGEGLRVRLVLAALEGATEVQELEQLQERPIVPIATTLLIDFADLGLPLENYEALAFGPRLRDGRRTLIVLADDNFDPVAQKSRLLAFAVEDQPLGIAEIQGAAHRSPLEGRWVAGVEGVVTAIDVVGGRRVSPGFAVESTEPDGDLATSEAIWVASAPDADLFPGARVRLTGRIEERAANASQLPVTTLVASAVERSGAGQSSPLPPPIALGRDALIPAQVDGDALGEFRPQRDALDFWESLESMRVELPPAIVTGPTRAFGEAVWFADDGGGEEHSDAGGRLLFPGGPELDRWLVGGRFVGSFPDLAVGARIAGPTVGIVDYSFSNYKVQLLAPPTIEAPGFGCRASTSLRSEGDRLTLATLNLENLSAAGPAERFEAFGRVIVERLGSPAVLALEEVQDDSGTAKGDGVVSAEQTLRKFVAAIVAAGGPRYQAISIDPELDREGGQPGGNIRVALLFDPARVGFEPRGSTGPLTAVTVLGMEETVRFEPNPGRVAPSSEAFTMTSGEGVRRSLAVELSVGGRPLFVIVNHWSSKWDDDKAFGAMQPPRRPTGEKRLAQSLVVRGFVERLLAASPQARVVVMGDLNDLPWSEPVERLSAPPLVNLLARVPSASRYTYNFEGSSQAIDYIIVSRSLAGNAEAEVVHLNSPCPDSVRISDHDPVVVALRIGPRARRPPA